MITKLRYLFSIAFSCLLFTACSQSISSGAAVAYPQPAGYVSDYDHILTAAETSSLDSLAQVFDRDTLAQFAIVTVDTTMTSRDSFDSYMIHLAKAWRVGHAVKNDGVTIGFCKAYRKIRIVNGYGIEAVISNAETKQIIDEKITPAFRQGYYADGLKAGMRSIVSLYATRTGRQ